MLGGEQEHAKLGSVEPTGVRWMHLRSADVLRRVRSDATVDVREAIEPAHCRESTVDRGGRKPPLIHRGAVELDVRPCRVEDKQLVLGRPLEEGAQVVPVRVQRSPAIAREKRGSR